MQIWWRGSQDTGGLESDEGQKLRGSAIPNPQSAIENLPSAICPPSSVFRPHNCDFYAALTGPVIVVDSHYLLPGSGTKTAASDRQGN